MRTRTTCGGRSNSVALCLPARSATISRSRTSTSTRAAVGETWQIGTALLRVTEPRFPCFKLGIRMADASFVERFATARRFGTYFTIVEPGSIAAGDEARRLDRPTDVLTIAEFIRANEEKDPELLGRVADHALVADAWREHARRALQRRTRTVPE